MSARARWLTAIGLAATIAGGCTAASRATCRWPSSSVRLWDPCCSHPTPSCLKWSVDGDGTLHFQQLAGPPDWTLTLPFPRIGDVPE